MTDDTRLRDPIAAVFWEEMDRVHTYFPGEIVSIGNTDGLVNVKPSHKVRFFGEDSDTDMPVINNCILKHSRSEAGIIRFPKEKLKGSRVGVFIAEHSLNEWRSSKGKSLLPIEGRRFNINDAVAVLGLYPETIPWPVTQKPNTLEIMFKEDCKGYFGNTAGDDLFDLVYQLAEIAAKPDSNNDTLTGTSTKGNNISQIVSLLSKIGNVT